MAETKTCIRCNRVCGQKDKYCVDCGAPLHNTCTNNGGLTGEPCTKVNEPNAAFCASCGAPTTFQKLELLPRPIYPAVPSSDESEEFEIFNHTFFLGEKRPL